MSTSTSVDRDAPVLAYHEVDVDATMDTVWRLHVDVNAWPSWQPDITAAHLEGMIERGVSFDWTSLGFSVTSTVDDVAERARVLWGGTAEGITGVHEWLFSQTSTGVHVVTNESFAGEPVSADPGRMQSVLDGLSDVLASSPQGGRRVTSPTIGQLPQSGDNDSGLGGLLVGVPARITHR